MTYSHGRNNRTPRSREIHCLKCWWTGPADACKIRIITGKTGSILSGGRKLKHYHCPHCDALVKATYIVPADTAP